jgi:glycosyltransferase involved in cell wall biosynthesis
MKIIHIALSLRVGGLEHLVCEMASYQVSQGHDVLICSLDPMPDEYQHIRKDSLRVVYLNRRRGVDLRMLWRLLLLLGRERPDVVHTHNITPLLCGAVLARIIRRPVYVNTRHGEYPFQRPRWIWDSYDHLVAISHAAQKQLLLDNKLPARRVRVIHNGIIYQKYGRSLSSEIRKKYEEEFRVFPGQCLVGIVARLSQEKGHQVLIHAFKQVSGRLNAKLLIIGDGALRDSLVQQVRDLQLKEHVMFLGFRKDIPELLAMIDLFVLSSFTEGISLTLLEAMASGKPVVATMAGGNPEVVVDRQTGYLVPAGDESSMAEALIHLLCDPKQREGMGIAGRERVIQYFSMENMMADYHKLYTRAKT